MAGRDEATVEVHGIDEWLTAVASAAAVGITSEATRNQFPRPGIRYRVLRDTPPIPVWLAWWTDNPPAQAAAFDSSSARSTAPPRS